MIQGLRQEARCQEKRESREVRKIIDAALAALGSLGGNAGKRTFSVTGCPPFTDQGGPPMGLRHRKARKSRVLRRANLGGRLVSSHYRKPNIMDQHYRTSRRSSI
jgi:hypothetical protein